MINFVHIIKLHYTLASVAEFCCMLIPLASTHILFYTELVASHWSVGLPSDVMSAQCQNEDCAHELRLKSTSLTDQLALVPDHNKMDLFQNSVIFNLLNRSQLWPQVLLCLLA